MLDGIEGGVGGVGVIVVGGWESAGVVGVGSGGGNSGGTTGEGGAEQPGAPRFGACIEKQKPRSEYSVMAVRAPSTTVKRALFRS